MLSIWPIWKCELKVGNAPLKLGLYLCKPMKNFMKIGLICLILRICQKLWVVGRSNERRCLGLRASLGVKNVPKPNNNNRAILDYFYFVDPGGQKSEQWHLLTIVVALKLQSQITSTATTQSAFLWHLPNRILCLLLHYKAKRFPTLFTF